MQAIFAQHALLGSTWRQHVRVCVEDMHIQAIEVQTTPQPGDVQVDTLLPALANLHSHSFQRAMAGMTETRAAGRDSFWTWREMMYRFVTHLTPEDYEAIAALVFLEMQETGYASVGEFHYVHHQPDGTPYDAVSELSQRVFAAAAQTGIGLTHLPVLYSYGGPQRAELGAGQKRFGNDVGAYLDLVAEARQASRALPADTRVGIAPHSLRATCPEDLTELLAGRETRSIHIHIAEQLKEVEDIRLWLGETPVAWLLQNAPVDDTWCLIHATHMTEAETVDLAHSGAVAGLCPITEANLGDGPFNGPAYVQSGGRFGIGSDSNVCISLTEELRALEYSQRIRDHSRNVMVPGEGSVGAHLYLSAATGGVQALSRDSGEIRIGKLADLVAIDRTDPALLALNDAQLLDGLCFAAKDRVVTDLWSAGRHQVRAGRHVARDAILANYKAAIARLVDVI
ncbi:formimidoylglutamate deiminase [Ruegeria sp. 2205SS24-7]|uniref:formimidoylglutamate deiminase n=1 Tax=Ruegeria discodermiae TaxID=3064389 RepID=UPI0027419AF2|nr:formimidoylglutamate deiminase [Ruegeria sp. 2205SS24-7]MDP5219974.1 formimidoylglutamate deiminase [Ruegeria sp. 2205SS24-7]